MLAFLAVILAQAAAAPPSTVAEPIWTRKPTFGELHHYYPELALMNRMSGRAVIACVVDDAGKLKACRAEEETPAGFGFGEAALKAADLFQMRPTTSDGRPVAGGTVRIPIWFDLGGKSDGMTAALECYGATANRAEADPSDTNWYATRFWALQSMAFAGAAHIPPSSVERDLEAARGGAAQKQVPHASATACDETMRAAIKK